MNLWERIIDNLFDDSQSSLVVLPSFSKKLGDASEDQGEWFHEDIKEMENRYKGQWNINMTDDYCHFT